MSTILDTVVGYEDQVIAFVKDAKKPVVEYVAKGVELVDGRLPEVTYPTALPTPLEVIAWFTPLWHGVTLCRDLTLGTVSWGDVGHLAYLLAFVAVGLVAARWTYARRLVV